MFLLELEWRVIQIQDIIGAKVWMTFPGETVEIKIRKGQYQSAWARPISWETPRFTKGTKARSLGRKPRRRDEERREAGETVELGSHVTEKVVSRMGSMRRSHCIWGKGNHRGP